MEQGEMPGLHGVETVEEERDRLTKEISEYVAALGEFIKHTSGEVIPLPNFDAMPDNKSLRNLAKGLKEEFGKYTQGVEEIIKSSN